MAGFGGRAPSDVISPALLYTTLQAVSDEFLVADDAYAPAGGTAARGDVAAVGRRQG